jgi:predicted nucleic acid-binding protein
MTEEKELGRARTSMSAAEFLDSNVLVYAFDKRDPKKQRRARDLVENGLLGHAVVSTQVLAEFAATLIHKFVPPVPMNEVLAILDVLFPFKIVRIDASTVRRAVETRVTYGVHLYDGMIIAAAESAGCSRIWSEDLNSGQQYFGVSVQNPFTTS